MIFNKIDRLIHSLCKVKSRTKVTLETFRVANIRLIESLKIRIQLIFWVYLILELIVAGSNLKGIYLGLEISFFLVYCMILPYAFLIFSFRNFMLVKDWSYKNEGVMQLLIVWVDLVVALLCFLLISIYIMFVLKSSSLLADYVMVLFISFISTFIVSVKYRTYSSDSVCMR